MSKIRVLSDQLANQIAAGEVVERPASVAKELVENAIDAGATRIAVDAEAGGRRLLRVTDDGNGMSRDDAMLAFERHATSKISRAEDLHAIGTLGFRGEALASIASVARVELVTKEENAPAGTRVLIEGGRLRDVKDAAHPQGTTITVRDLFFNVPARRKFLRSEATESFHLANVVTHYALAQPNLAFVLTNNGRETLRAAPARDLRERAYQIFGADFIENLLEVSGGHPQVARVRGFVSAPRERRTSRDAQYLFINGRFVRDRLIGRALSEAYRTVLPQGVFPAALLLLEVPLEDVDVNVHPAKTEVRFRRAAAVVDAVREAVRQALANAGYLRAGESPSETKARSVGASQGQAPDQETIHTTLPDDQVSTSDDGPASTAFARTKPAHGATGELVPPGRRENIDFRFTPPDLSPPQDKSPTLVSGKGNTARDLKAIMRRAYSDAHQPSKEDEGARELPALSEPLASEDATAIVEKDQVRTPVRTDKGLPPLVSAAHLVREVPVESLTDNIRPLGQLDESYIIATDDEGLLLIDQHIAHERILFDKYQRLEGERRIDSQNLLMPETFDLTPAQATAFDLFVDELEAYGFGLMRLSGRTVAIKAVPADLPAGAARNVLADVLATLDPERRGTSQSGARDEIAASVACHAAIKAGTTLAPEKMRWLIDRLLVTQSPTICPHGRPVILRLAMRDIEKGFHRT